MLTFEISLSIFNALVASGKIDFETKRADELAVEAAKIFTQFDPIFQKVYLESKQEAESGETGTYA